MVLLLWLSSCSRSLSPLSKSKVVPPRGGFYHTVRSGETLSGIGLRYGVSYRELARLNRIANPDKIWVGQKIFIPGSARRPGSRRFEGRATGSLRSERLFVWPLRGKISSHFGPRRGSFHDGIDITAPVGTPVRASADGRVIYSHKLRGYGNVIIIRHAGGFVTVYAHNRVNLVREGERVRQGQKIAEVGTSGRTTGPNLHFEVRKNNIAQNPLLYLPRGRALVQNHMR